MPPASVKSSTALVPAMKAAASAELACAERGTTLSDPSARRIERFERPVTSASRSSPKCQTSRSSTEGIGATV